MKKTNRPAESKWNLDELFSGLKSGEILSEYEQYSIRGGDGDGGGDLIIIPPPPPPETGN